MYSLYQEFDETVSQLYEHYSVFNIMAGFAYPYFTTDLDTACITFNDIGSNLDFLFNPDFWQKCNNETRKFVVCHEALHVLFNHGRRITEILSKKSQNLMMYANVAMDIVINELLISEFNFKKEEINISACFIDTVFKDTTNIERNKSFEYYYNLLIEDSANVNDSIKGLLLNDHKNLIGMPEKILEELAKSISENLTSDEIQKINNFSKGIVGEPPLEGLIERVCLVKKTKKKKWESIIKYWTAKSYNLVDEEQWARRSRRLTNEFSKNGKLLLPSDYETEGSIKDRLDVFFFLDCSGSCFHLSDRFFKAAASLDPKKFNVRLFGRTTTAREVFLDKKDSINFSGGGSDDFRCMERKIQELLKSGDIKKYPSAVFHITDGYDCSGHLMKCEKPERWHFFLTGSSTKNWIPKGCHIHYLSDFE